MSLNNHYAKQVDDNLPFGHLGDLTTSEKIHQCRQKRLQTNASVKQVVGHSLGCSVALKFQNNCSCLRSNRYGALAFQLKECAMPHFDNTNVDS